MSVLSRSSTPSNVISKPETKGDDPNPTRPLAYLENTQHSILQGTYTRIQLNLNVIPKMLPVLFGVKAEFNCHYTIIRRR
jgi:hypothetical protein